MIADCGSGWPRIAELHPNAEFKKDRWWLYRAWAPYGDIGDYPVLEALMSHGRVSALYGWTGAAAE